MVNVLSGLVGSHARAEKIPRSYHNALQQVLSGLVGSHARSYHNALQQVAVPLTIKLHSHYFAQKMICFGTWIIRDHSQTLVRGSDAKRGPLKV